MRKFRLLGIFGDITGRGQKDIYYFPTLRGIDQVISSRRRKIKNFKKWK